MKKKTSAIDGNGSMLKTISYIIYVTSPRNIPKYPIANAAYDFPKINDFLYLIAMENPIIETMSGLRNEKTDAMESEFSSDIAKLIKM